MSLTPVTSASSGSTSPKTSPNSITTVSYVNRPSSVSAWTESAPQVLYTAPSDCKYVRIVIPDTGKQSTTSYTNESFSLDSDGSHNRWLGIGIVNDTNNTEDMILKNYSGNTSYELYLNSFSQGRYPRGRRSRLRGWRSRAFGRILSSRPRSCCPSPSSRPSTSSYTRRSGASRRWSTTGTGATSPSS